MMLLRYGHGVLYGRILVGRDLLIGRHPPLRQRTLAVMRQMFLYLSRNSLIVTWWEGGGTPVIISMLTAP